jgi:hypothetical protein
MQYWIISTVIAAAYLAFAILIARCCGLNDSEPEE